CGGIDLHQDAAVVDRSELQNEGLVIVPESSEKPTVQQEGGHAGREALHHVRKLEQELACVRNRDTPRRGFPAATAHVDPKHPSASALSMAGSSQRNSATSSLEQPVCDRRPSIVCLSPLSQIVRSEACRGSVFAVDDHELLTLRLIQQVHEANRYPRAGQLEPFCADERLDVL